MEEQIVTITVVTRGAKCEMTNQEIVDWYQTHVANLFNPTYGVPEITVQLTRTVIDH